MLSFSSKSLELYKGMMMMVVVVVVVVVMVELIGYFMKFYEHINNTHFDVFYI